MSSNVLKIPVISRLRSTVLVLSPVYPLYSRTVKHIFLSPVFTNGETHFLIPAKYFALISRRGFLSAPERIIFHITPLKHML